jgi:hypothetical protein
MITITNIIIILYYLRLNCENEKLKSKHDKSEKKKRKKPVEVVEEDGENDDSAIANDFAVADNPNKRAPRQKR